MRKAGGFGPIAAMLLTMAGASLQAESAAGQTDAVHEITFPEPWGPHAVGVRTILLIDSTRADTLSPSPADFRPILVRVWYPADPADMPARPYMPAAVADAWRNNMPAPDGFEAGVRTHGLPDAPVSAARTRWPVLLFSPGRSFPVENYQLALEHLASAGWIVAAISTPYEEALTLLPDGRELPFAGPRWDSEEKRGTVLMSVVDEMVRDASFIIDRLEQAAQKPHDPFYGKLDLSVGVGYFGHSLGGAAAAWTMQRDHRVRAAVSWEGQVYRDTDRPLDVTGGSLLYIIASANRSEFAGTQYRPGRTGVAVHELVIHGSWHASFGDMLHIYRQYAPPDWQARHRRYVTPERVNQITNDYIHEFFSHCLLGEPLDLLWPDSQDQKGNPGIADYAEVELRSYWY